MQNEWHANQHKINPPPGDLMLSVIITFFKDGSVQNIRVMQSSGSAELDEFLVKGIRKAGPYPPLPKHFNSDTFDLPLTILHTQDPSSARMMSFYSPIRKR
jgi:TonB family protein